MKKLTGFAICCLVLFFSAFSSFAQEGFTGPSVPGRADSNAVTMYRPATVAQLPSLTREARVVLTGYLVNSVRREYYTFRDNTGEIIVEIERKYWGGLTVGPNDLVQIFGKAEKKRDGRIEVEAAIVRKL
jgi:uncharacterized protein (TIGR00156 family)